jgi:uncharacterized Zn finger protein
MYEQWAPYVSVAERRRKAAAEMNKLRKKGHPVSPVEIAGRAIATTVWGKAWCANLEAYGDYANRLPRGRTYVRNGSVVDLQIAPGRIDAHVSGSSMYRVTVTVSPLVDGRWKTLCADCAGEIDSLVELLQGRLSTGVMERLCRPRDGLFPAPKEIKLACSCPDGASMCKHVAAVLYGIGARLDHEPHLLFTLRQVDATDLLANAGAGLAVPGGSSGDRVLAADDLSALFGVEIDLSGPAPRDAAAPARARAKTKEPAAAKRAGKAPPAPRPPGKPLISRLLHLLRKQGPLTNVEVQEALGADVATLRPLLQRLIDEGLAAKSGRGKGMTYGALD